MTVIMNKTLKEKLEKVKKREWWPVASLAEVLEKSKVYIYNHIDKGDFDTIKDGGFTKITSNSIVKFFEDK